MNLNKETFCALPFTEIFLGPDGMIKPCCSSNTSLGDLNKNSIQEILQSHRSHELRKSILDGKWHESCIQCQRQERQGVRSERADNIETFQQYHGVNINETYFKLRRLDLRWSNTCNLSCTYCYEYFSSKWAEIKGIKVNTLLGENEESLFLLIEEQKDSVENILMLGGEPLLQKQNIRLIEAVANKNFYVLTNLSTPLRSNKVAQQLLKKPSVRIGISIETIGNRFEYVRHGASWDIFNSNLDYLISQRPHLDLDLHSLYSIYSAFNLVEFYEYVTDKNIFKMVYWNLLESSGENQHASVFKLSPELKKDAIDEINRVLERFPDAPGVSSLVIIKETLHRDAVMEAKNLGFLEEANRLEILLRKAEGLKFKDLWPDIYARLSA